MNIPKIPRGTATRNRGNQPLAVTSHPSCTGCGAPVERRPGETASSWIGRRSCSRRCSARASNLARATEAAERWREAVANHPPCAICRGAVTKSRDLEPLARFVQRATCSDKCYRKHQKAMSGRPAAGASPAPILPPYRKGELWPIDFAGGFGRQNVVTKPDSRRLPMRPAARSYMSASAGWLL